MFIPLLPPRGNAVKVAAYTGLSGSIVVNTDVSTIHVQDGQTAGGFALSKVGHQHAFNEITSFLGFTPAQLGPDGKLLSSQIPKIAVTDTTVVGSLAEMLALTAETGDMAIRTDLSETFILRGTDPTVESDWQEFLSPTSDVTSVNGQRGTVTLSSSDIDEGTNKYYTDTRSRNALSLVAGASGAVYNAATGVLNLSAVVAPPGGATTQIQYNKNGVFGGSADFTFDSATGLVSATGFSGSGAALTDLNAASLTGLIAVARLGSGLPSISTYLRGDGSWQPLSLSSSQVTAALGYTPVNTVNAKSGASIVLTTSDVSEGASLYFTTARARGAISLNAGSSGALYSATTGVLDLSALLTNLNASNLTSGTVAPARLGSGTASATTYLRGDNTWGTPGTVSSVTVTSANGVSAAVATQGTAPALTFTLSDITPTSVTTTGLVQGGTLSAGTSLSSTAGDITANRGGTGIVFLGRSNAYVYFDGTGYSMPNFGLTVGGDVTGTSDARVKTDIEVIPDALNKLQEINGVTFRRIDGEDPNDPTRYAGVIAQDVEKVLPEAVTESKPREDGTGGGVKGVAHAAVVGLLVEAVKELKAQVTSLQAQLAAVQEAQK